MLHLNYGYSITNYELRESITNYGIGVIKSGSNNEEYELIHPLWFSRQRETLGAQALTQG